MDPRSSFPPSLPVPSFPVPSFPPGSLLPFGPPGFFRGSGFCAAAPSRPPRSPAPPPTLAVLRYDTLKFPLRGRAIRDSEPLSKFDNLHFQHLPREKKLLIAGHPTFFAPGPSSRMLSFELLCGYTYALLFLANLRGARSRLYRRRFLQVNTRWKALAEI